MFCYSRDDFAFMCQQLNLEDLTDEILLQLGIQKTSRISFDDFIKCRSQVCQVQFLYTGFPNA